MQLFPIFRGLCPARGMAADLLVAQDRRCALLKIHSLQHRILSELFFEQKSCFLELFFLSILCRFFYLLFLAFRNTYSNIFNLIS